ncbi:MAG: bifunctional adenosylcobinamide kinase/adenosylcobinamide-phosphate guanylyltransferase [Gammaproteobacteria bacterium]|nr:bifunctional adenosylcobinamide kinase/adenosylcobinamide-phosphate guanylyltransferase [Gammaproteobacteria bacterium]MDH5651131.1 bifunctional adenosylcobinamide kinase/adenosylcobinamide-phosphate guanylyltransferase [Gammaproteobacteria bacterium]
MQELILGGARSGKSSYAEQRAQASGLHVIYIATATAQDKEMAERITRHRQQRPDHWQLIEEPLDLVTVLQTYAAPDACLLVDCLTLWLSNLLAQDNLGELEQQQAGLLHLLPDLPGDIILVSNETGLGIIPMGELTRRFVDEAGRLHQRLAAQCDRVTLMIAGLPQQLKP